MNMFRLLIIASLAVLLIGTGQPGLVAGDQNFLLPSDPMAFQSGPGN